MRILIATGVYPPESGGPATYTKLLEERLPEQGFRIKVLPFRTVRRLPKIMRHVAYFFKVLRYGKKADVIFAQDPVSVGLPACMAARLLRKKFVLKVVGDYAWEQGRQRGGVKETLDAFQGRRYGFFVEILRAIEHRVARRAVRVIVPSEYLAKIVRGWGVHADKISVVYNGVNFSEAPVVPSLVPAGRLIVTVARLVPWKGIDALIGVVAQEKSWSLAIVGDGPERAKLEKLVAVRNVSDRVHFAGLASHAEAIGWISAGEVFVLNSSYEGMSHVLLEALYLGRPVVATRAGGNTEVINDGDDGILVAVGDTKALYEALSRILSDSALALRLGVSARHHAKNFSINETVRKTGEILKDICEY